MRETALGTAGIDVSAICLGTMHLGSKEDTVTSYAILDAYVEAGGSFLDTANIYACWIDGSSGGESEELLGAWMKDRGNRGDLVLASKVGFPYPGVEQGLKKSQIVEECDKSLRRLGVETVDLYYAHVDDRRTPLEESLAAFDALVSQGKVRFIGASNFSSWRLAEARCASAANGFVQYSCVQQRHTYLRPKPGATFAPQLSATEELLDYCSTNGLTLLAYSPLLGGAYVRDDKAIGAQYLGPDADRRLEILDQVAAEVGAGRNELILAWMMLQTPPIIPVTSAGSAAQLKENLRSLDLSLSPEQIERLNAAGA